MERRTSFSILYYLVVLAAFTGIELWMFSGFDAPELPYSDFLAQVAADRVQTVVITDDALYVQAKPEQPASAGPAPLAPPKRKTPWHPGRIAAWLRSAPEKVGAPPEHFTVVPVDDPQLVPTLAAHHVQFGARIETHRLRDTLLNWVLPFGLTAVVWALLMRRMGSGPSTLSMGQSKAKLVEVTDAKSTRFSDVAGVDEAVTEVAEVVDFLRNPGRYTSLGARLPKGVLLVGPPGTGKTLLARAVAGEAGVPFFSISGSDFVEMFVGVGAARVRDLFAEAVRKAPCIIFVDEIDAIGKRRRQGATMGGFDETENTLNQLLVEMDGFDGTVGVVLMAATNRPETLDPALLRPGRFDRQVLVDRPDRDGRLAILLLHARNLALGDDVSLGTVATRTVGMVGADLANLCNEAALLAARADRVVVQQQDFDEALERVIGGLERKSRVLNPLERAIVAVHESGHALVSHLTPGADPVQKVSIVPRGRGALGYTLQAPLEDRFLMTRDELIGRIRVLLAGRAAEAEVRGEISTGAADDLEKAARLARRMITVYGMGPKTPNLSLSDPDRAGLLGPEGEGAHSDELEQSVEAQVADLLDACYREARALIAAHRGALDAMAARLLDREKLELSDIVAILGPASPEARAAR